MGKATIYTHEGGGQYTALYQRHNALAASRVDELEAIKDALDVQLASGDNSLINARDAAELIYSSASADFEAALSDWAACAMMQPPCEDQSRLMDVIRGVGTKRAEAAVALNTIKAAISENRAKYFSATQEIAFLNSTAKTDAAGELMTLWCIDYDPDNIIPASTVVGTIETFGAWGDHGGGYLPRPYINISTSADADYNASRDKCATPLSSQGTATLMYNYMQWAYVMANNPLHAIGKVLSKFDDLQDYLDIELFGTTPTGAHPDFYPYTKPDSSSVILLNVPVDYLSCGAQAFEENDIVVVRFAGLNRSDPTVIGFADNPTECRLSSIYVQSIFYGDTLSSIRSLKRSDTCSTEFVETITPSGLGWLDWIDSTGKAKLWIQIPGSVCQWRYGKYISNPSMSYDIHRRSKNKITVASSIYGITEVNGVVYYVTKSDTYFILKKYDETIIASISIASIVAVLPDYFAHTETIDDIIDGWFKFSTNGRLGATLLTTQHYLHISITGEETISATLSVVEMAAPASFKRVEIVDTEYIDGFCPRYVLDTDTGYYKVWALDFIGNDINFLFIETYTESLSKPVTTFLCPEHSSIVCDYRRVSTDVNKYSIGPSRASATELFSAKDSPLITHASDGFPDINNTGIMRMTDLDIRRKAAAFFGFTYYVSGSTATPEVSAVLVYDGVPIKITGLDDPPSAPQTLTPSPIISDGGFMEGGQEYDGVCFFTTSHADVPLDAETGRLEFTGTDGRVDLFSIDNEDGLFFINSVGGHVVKQYRYCSGYTNISASFEIHPTSYGYACG